jgi:hypothetical protein
MNSPSVDGLIMDILPRLLGKAFSLDYLLHGEFIAVIFTHLGLSSAICCVMRQVTQDYSGRDADQPTDLDHLLFPNSLQLLPCLSRPSR